MCCVPPCSGIRLMYSIVFGLECSELQPQNTTAYELQPIAREDCLKIPCKSIMQSIISCNNEGYFGVCGIAVSGVISARYCGIKGKNWRYCGIEFLQRGMRYRYKSACTVHEILFF